MGNIFRVTGVIAYTLMVFLNAFVDLGHKIVIQNTLFKTLDGSEQIIWTAILNSLILLPLALLFSPAGFISDRFAKPKVMQKAAILAVIVTIGITACYYLGQFEIAFAMTLLLAIQSAIYSPAKYGYLRELVGKPKLSQANALVQAVTIVAILSGTFVFSIFFEKLLANHTITNAADILRTVAPIGWLLVAASIVELIFAYKLPAREASAPELKFEMSEYVRGKYSKKNIKEVYNDNVIWICIVGLAIFWGISQVMAVVFPAYAKENLGATSTVVVQGLLACVGLGIIIGSSIAGRISKNYIENGFIPVGAIGIATLLFIIPGLSSTATIAAAFVGVGIASGFFIVPLNALIQFHANESKMARVLAANNLFQTVSMLGFLVFTAIVSAYNVSSTSILIFLAIVASIGAIYTLVRLPHSLIRLFLGRAIGVRYRIAVQGLEHMPSRNGALLLGNHISFIDWAIIGIACPRKVRFVMHRDYYNKWYLKGFLNLMGCIPIAPGDSESALTIVAESLSCEEVVCLFPEGALTKDGELAEFKRGFERAASKVAAESNATIIPFYIHGLWGSNFSRAKQDKTQKPNRNLTVSFDQPIAIDSTAEIVRQKVLALASQAKTG